MYLILSLNPLFSLKFKSLIHAFSYFLLFIFKKKQAILIRTISLFPTTFIFQLILMNHCSWYHLIFFHKILLTIQYLFVFHLLYFSIIIHRFSLSFLELPIFPKVFYFHLKINLLFMRVIHCPFLCIEVFMIIKPLLSRMLFDI